MSKNELPLKDAIDFTTIQKNEVNKKTLHIEKKLQDFEETLEELLLTLKDEDVPNQAIKQKTKKILHKVLKNKPIKTINAEKYSQEKTRLYYLLVLKRISRKNL